MQISAGAFEDLAGNAFIGITDNTTWTFTTAASEDTQVPTVIAYSPANNTTEVDPATTITLTFNEAIQKGTAGSVTIYQGTTLLQTIDITSTAISISDNVVTLDPPQDFPRGATVNIQITAGAITDLANNAFAGITDNTT